MALERKVKWALSSQLMPHENKCIWWTLGHVTFYPGFNASTCIKSRRQRLPQGGGDNDFLRYSPIGFPDQSKRGMAQA